MKLQIAFCVGAFLIAFGSLGTAHAECGPAAEKLRESLKDMLGAVDHYDNREILVPGTPIYRRFQRIAEALKVVSVRREQVVKVPGMESHASIIPEGKASQGTIIKVGPSCMLTARHVINPSERPGKPDPRVRVDRRRKDFSNSDLNGMRVDVNLTWKGRVSTEVLEGVVVAGGVPEHSGMEVAVVKTVRPLPESMPTLRMGSYSLKELCTTSLVVISYSKDKDNTDGTPRLSAQLCNAIGETGSTGTDGKVYASGIQTDCVLAGRGSGGFVGLESGTKSGQPELIGLASTVIAPPGQVGDLERGFVVIVWLRSPWDQSGVTIQQKIEELIANGSC